MGDDRFRQLERAYKASGLLEDHAAYLRARLSAGDLELHRIELAALLRDPASERVLETPPGEDLQLDDLGDALAPMEIAALARVAVAIGRGAIERVEVSSRHRRLAFAALETTESWIVCPCAACGRAAAAAHAEIVAEGELPPEVHIEFDLERPDLPGFGGAALVGMRDPDRRHFLGEEILVARSVMSDEEILSRVQAEVVPWALGEGDGVRRRVERRRTAAKEVSASGKRRIYRVLCCLAACDGSVAPEENRVLREYLRGAQIPPEEARKLEAEGAARAGLRIGKGLAEQRELMDWLLDVAAADGVLAPEERERLLKIGDLVGLGRQELLSSLATRWKSKEPEDPPPTVAELMGRLSELEGADCGHDFPYSHRVVDVPLDSEISVRFVRCVLCDERISARRLPAKEATDLPGVSLDLRGAELWKWVIESGGSR